MSLEIFRTSLSLRLDLPMSLLTERFGPEVVSLGARLAQQAATIVGRERLGYFPALQFFADRSDVEPALVPAIIEAGTFARQHATHEVRTRLRHAFSNIRLQRAQCLAFTLPGVRPGPRDALEKLAAHYTPNALRVELQVTTLHKGGTVPEGMDHFASRRAQWWLREVFDTVEVIDVRAAGAAT